MPSEWHLDHIPNFDIDSWLNPIVPPSQLRRLPRPVSHFLGHREHTPTEPNNLISWTLTWFASVAGLCVVGAVYNYAPGIVAWSPPPLVASLGASAVLEYNTVRSPLAQPRNTIVGHALSAIVAVAISKGFQRYAIFPTINWVAAAIACATANVLMAMTNSVHPPGGATAILACIQPDIVAMGWRFVPLIVIATVLMCAVGCLMNNTLRWYPVYWWTSAEVGQAYRSRETEKRKEEEKQRQQGEEEKSRDLEKQKGEGPWSDSGRTDSTRAGAEDFAIRVGPDGISLPEGIEINQMERELLGEIRERLSIASAARYS